MTGQNTVDVISAGHPAPKTATYIPVGLHFSALVQTEPPSVRRRVTIRIYRHDFKINGVAQLEQVVVRAHVAVGLPEGDFNSYALTHMVYSDRQTWSDDDEVIKAM